MACDTLLTMKKVLKWIGILTILGVVLFLLWFAWMLRITFPTDVKTYSNEFLTFDYPADFEIVEETVGREHNINQYTNIDSYGFTGLTLERLEGIPFKIYFTALPRSSTRIAHDLDSMVTFFLENEKEGNSPAFAAETTLQRIDKKDFWGYYYVRPSSNKIIDGEEWGRIATAGLEIENNEYLLSIDFLLFPLSVPTSVYAYQYYRAKHFFELFTDTLEVKK